MKGCLSPSRAAELSPDQPPRGVLKPPRSEMRHRGHTRQAEHSVQPLQAQAGNELQSQSRGRIQRKPAHSPALNPLTVATGWNHLERFLKYGFPWPIPSDSNLTGPGWGSQSDSKYSQGGGPLSGGALRVRL